MRFVWRSIAVSALAWPSAALAQPATLVGPAPSAAGLSLGLSQASPACAADAVRAPAIDYRSRSALPRPRFVESGVQVVDPERGTLGSVRMAMPFPYRAPAETAPSRAVDPCAHAGSWNDTRHGGYVVWGARPRGERDTGFDSWSERPAAPDLRGVGR